jgi:regulatory protein
VEVQKRHKDRFNIFIDGLFAFSVYEDTMIRYKLFKDYSVDLKEIEEIVAADELQRAYNTAVRSLSSRMKSEQELADMLGRKGFEQSTIEQAIHKCKQFGFVDDTSFASAVAKQRMLFNKKGRLFVQRELQQKGIAKDLASEALNQIDPEEELAQAIALANKRWERMADKSYTAKRKLGDFLLRRGYSGTIAAKVLKQLKSEAEGDMDEDLMVYDIND